MMSCFPPNSNRLHSAISMPCMNMNDINCPPSIFNCCGSLEGKVSCDCNCNCWSKQIGNQFVDSNRCCCNRFTNIQSNNESTFNNLAKYCTSLSNICNPIIPSGEQFPQTNDFTNVKFTNNNNLLNRQMATNTEWIKPTTFEQQNSSGSMQNCKSYDMTDLHHPLPPVLVNAPSMLKRSQSMHTLNNNFTEGDMYTQTLGGSSFNQNSFHKQPDIFEVNTNLQNNAFPCKCNVEKTVAFDTNESICKHCGGKLSLKKECTFESHSTNDRISNIRKFWNNKECSPEHKITVEKLYDEENSKIVIKSKPECVCRSFELENFNNLTNHEKRPEIQEGIEYCHRCGLPPKPRRNRIRRSETVIYGNKRPSSTISRTVPVSRRRHTSSTSCKQIPEVTSATHISGSVEHGNSFIKKTSVDLERIGRYSIISKNKNTLDDMDKYLKPSSDPDYFSPQERYYYVNKYEPVEDRECASKRSLPVGNKTFEQRLLSPKVTAGNSNQNTYITGSVIRPSSESGHDFAPRNEYRTPGGVIYTVDMPDCRMLGMSRYDASNGTSYGFTSDMNQGELSQKYEKYAVDLEHQLRNNIEKCENDLRIYGNTMSNQAAGIIRVAIVRANSIIDDQLKTLRHFCSLLKDGRYECYDDKIPHDYNLLTHGLLNYWDDIQSLLDDIELSFQHIDNMRDNSWSTATSYKTYE